MKEWLAVQPDRQTLRPVGNISSKDVELEINGEDVPKRGLYSELSITTTKREPFSVPSDENKIKLSVNKGEDQIITIPAGESVSAFQISKSIQNQSEDINSEANNGHVVLSVDKTVNKKYKSLFLKNGSAHSSIGLKDRRFYKNKQVYPAWYITKEETLFGDSRRIVEFEEPLNSEDDIIEASYYTRQKDCRRCQGVGIEDDIRYNQQGEPRFVRDEQLLLQEAEKIVFTIRGSNVFYQWYGTSLKESIGSKIIGGNDSLRGQLVAEITDALNRYRQIKSQQKNIQPVSNEEFLLKIREISVTQDDVDPTVFDVDIELSNRSNRRRSISKTIVLNEDSRG
jgi:hypothetical protein